MPTSLEATNLARANKLAVKERKDQSFFVNQNHDNPVQNQWYGTFIDPVLSGCNSCFSNWNL